MHHMAKHKEVASISLEYIPLYSDEKVPHVLISITVSSYLVIMVD